MQNLFNSHDTNRIASHIVNRGIGRYGDWGNYFGKSKPLDNPNYLQRKPNATDIKLQRLFVTFQMTYVGAPMIYYGDEVGLWGGNDPDCRKPMLWTDIRYENERFNVDGKIARNDAVRINRSLLQHYQKLMRLRSQNEALQLGDFKTILANNDVYVFQRSYQLKRVIVAINRSNQPQTIPYPLSSTAIDLYNHRQYNAQTKQIRLAPMGFSILEAL